MVLLWKEAESATKFGSRHLGTLGLVTGAFHAPYNQPVKVVTVIAVFAAWTTNCVLAESMTRLERQRLIAHLEMTEQELSDSITGLSFAQLQFRPSAESWNLLEVLEHLVVAEPIYWQDLKKALAAPPDRPRRSGSDDSVLWYGIDRTQRQKAIPAEQPTRQLRDVRKGLMAFHKLRGQMLEYARTTQDDLRSHTVQRERCDAYQWFLLISTHAQRHSLQIREIKAHPDFPDK